MVLEMFCPCEVLISSTNHVAAANHYQDTSQMLSIISWRGWLTQISSSPDWSFTNLQSTLVMIFFLMTTIYFNTWGAKLLTSIEVVSLGLHLAGFVITIIPLWVLAPKNSASDVFGPIVNGGGWSNRGTAFLVGMITILFSNLGPDAAVHIGKLEFSHSLTWA